MSGAVRCQTHMRPVYTWDGRQWGWMCGVCLTRLVLIEADSQAARNNAPSSRPDVESPSVERGQS